MLGCVLLSPNDCLGQCIEKLKAGADVFYDLRHQTIYTALVEMYDSREPIDVITVQQRLKDRQLLDQIGGIPYLNALQDAVPSAANARITRRLCRRNISCGNSSTRVRMWWEKFTSSRARWTC